MNRLRTLILSAFAIVPALVAQSAPAGTIQASGTATIQVPPDQASLTIGVVTQAATAQEAAQQNAAQAATMIAALNALVGKNGSVKTIAYSVSPRYASSGNQTVIVGYTASNTVQVVTYAINNSLAIIGQIIDAGNLAGGNNISGVSFGLQDPEPDTRKALGEAAKQALAHAAAIAAGLGAKTGAVLSAQESSTYIPYRTDAMGAAVTATPIQSGTVGVSATVSVSVQLLQ